MKNRFAALCSVPAALFFCLFTLPAHGQSWETIRAGYNYTLVLQENGTLWSCGQNDYHQLGRDNQPEGAIYQTGTSNKWASVAAGYQVSVGIQKDSTLWIWGRQHPVNPDSLYNDVPMPVQVDALHNWIKVSAGYFQIFAIKTDSTLWGWGDNNYGAVGNGTSIGQKIPTKIGGTSKWRDVQSGDQFSLAIKNDSTLWAWGRNDVGQYGDGSYVSKNFPVQVGTAKDWKSISAGVSHAVAIKNDGTLWAWGINQNYAVGDGTNAFSRNVPVQISPSTDWASISAGDSYSFALKTDGSLWGWGYNGTYQLGNGTANPVTTPTQIGNSYDWKAASAGTSHSLGLKEDGTLLGWGDGSFGSLGCITGAPVPVELDCAFTSVEHLLPEESFAIYPNPANRFIYVGTQGEPAGEYQYALSNPLGMVISTGRIKDASQAIELNGLAQGLYFITIKTAKGQQTRPFVKI